MPVAHSHFCKPMDLLSQVFWYSYQKSCSKEEAICHLSHIREPKLWLMSGNPMRVEDCVAKCQRWAKHFPIEWDDSVNGTFSVSMHYASFTYSWNKHEAHLVINAEGAKNLGWGETEYHLKGKHCPDIEKVFTLNERIQNAVLLPSLVSWCKQEGIYDRKKFEFHELLQQLNWWTSTLRSYSMFKVKLCSTRKLLNRLPIDDEIKVKAWIGEEQFEMFRFNFHDSKSLDKLFANHYLPELRARINYMRGCIDYLKSNAKTGKSFPLDKQPEGFSYYNGYVRKVLKKSISDEHIWIYNTIYDAALHLWNDMGYNSRLCYFEMESPQKPKPDYHFYFSCGNKYSSMESTERLSCSPEELNDKFPEFYDKFKKKAIATAENAISQLELIVKSINKRIEE